MPVIIDGYNALFRLFGMRALSQGAIEALIEACKTKRATLLFDNIEGEPRLYATTRHYHHLTISYTPHGLSADDYIIETLRAATHPSTLLIVTSDERLASLVRELGGRSQSIETYFTKGKRCHSSGKEKIERETPAERERLRKIFEARQDAIDDAILDDAE